MIGSACVTVLAFGGYAAWIACEKVRQIARGTQPEPAAPPRTEAPRLDRLVLLHQPGSITDLLDADAMARQIAEVRALPETEPEREWGSWS